MEIYLITKKEKINITQKVTQVVIRGEYRSCCRTLDLGVIKNTEETTDKLVIQLGDNIKIIEKEKVIFYGVVWNKSKATGSNEINIECKDYGIYLLKNKKSYKFTDIPPEMIVRRICSEFKIECGEIASTNKPISRNFIGVDLYSIIMSSYHLASDKKYMCIFEQEKLNVIEKGVQLCEPLNSGENILTSSVSESLNNMVNKVNVFNDKDKLIKSFENSEDIKKYGLLSEQFKVSDNQKDYEPKAKQMLKEIEHKISVTNIGDGQYRTGKSVVVTEQYTGLQGKFYIDSDEHSWKKGVYTNKLVLNFKNLMDEKKSGSEVSNG